MKIKAGIIAAVPNAAILSQAVPVEVTKDVETTGIVLSPVCVSIKTKINSVQLKIKQRTAVAAMPPIARGTINRQNTKNLVAPSNKAASSISFGISSKKLFISRTARGKFINA